MTAVLLVEDDDIARRAFRTALRHGGFEVIASPDAIDAVNAIAARPDLAAAIIDVRLPRTDGFAAARLLRDLNPRLKILYYTSRFPPPGLDTEEVFGAVIERPSDPDALIRAVKRLFEPPPKVAA
jgi:CheY-like chemotaxis protein